MPDKNEMKSKFRRATATLATILLLIAFAAASCKTGGKTETGKTGEKTEASSESKGGKITNPEAFRDKLLKTMVCPQHKVTLFMDGKGLAPCEYRNKIAGAVDRMIKGGWTESEIKEVTGLLNPLFTPIANAQKCGGQNGKMRADFFLMSYCPYGLLFADRLLPSIIADFGENMEWVPHYIVQDKGGKLESMHGPEEVAEDRYQACMFKHYGGAEWINYMRCYAREMNNLNAKFQQNPPKDGKAPDMAAEHARINATCTAASPALSKPVLSKCVAEESEALLRTDMALSNRLGANASPTSVVNCSESLPGAVDYNMVKPYLCTFYDDKKMPLACNQQ